MSQATLSERPFINSNLFSGPFLDERAEELDEQIRRTDDPTDEIVYDLTDEEIEIVEQAVGE